MAKNLGQKLGLKSRSKKIALKIRLKNFKKKLAFWGGYKELQGELTIRTHKKVSKRTYKKFFACFFGFLRNIQNKNSYFISIS